MKISKTEIFILNRYAASELTGGLIIGKMSRKVSDPYLRLKLAWHCAEETRHGAIWYKLIDELKIPSLEIHDSDNEEYFSYLNKVENIIDFLAMVHLYEFRVPFHFQMHLKWTKDIKVKTALRKLIEEEQQHLSWIKNYLQKEYEKDNSQVLESIKKFSEIENNTYLKDLRRLEEMGDDGKEFVSIIRKHLPEYKPTILK